MLNKVWTIAAATVMVVAVVTLFAIRPELANNPNIWVGLIPMIPTLFAVYKAEDGSRKAEKSLDETVHTRRELKNGTMTRVVEEAVIAALRKHGIQVSKEDENDA